MIIPSPSVLEHFHAERQRRLQPKTAPMTARTAPAGRPGLRVRIGHALIGAGTAIAGERVERTRHDPQPRAI